MLFCSGTFRAYVPCWPSNDKTFSIIKNTDMIKRSGLFLFFVFKLGLKVNFCFCFSCRCYSSYVKELKTSLTVSTHYVVPLSLCPLVFVCISFLQLSFMAHQNKLADSFTFLPHNLIFIQWKRMFFFFCFFFLYPQLNLTRAPWKGSCYDYITSSGFIHWIEQLIRFLPM